MTVETTHYVESATRTFDLASVGRVLHGIGSLEGVNDLLDARSSRRAVIVSCASIINGGNLIERLSEHLGDRLAGIAPPVRSHTPTTDVDAVVEFVESVAGDAIIAIGGSSVSDGAKFAALRLAGGEPALVIHDGEVTQARSGLTEAPVTLIDIPTTLSAGTFHPAAGMTDDLRGAKYMANDDRLLPWAVVLDPEATLLTPPDLWASSGVKAIDHAAEAVWGDRAHPYGDALALDALARLSRSLPVSLSGGDQLDARLDCQIGAWLSIATMKNTLIHFSHCLEHNMGSYWGVGHGVTSCMALPLVMDYLADEQPAKVARVARALSGDEELSGSDIAVAKRGAIILADLIDSLGMTVKLRDVLPTQDDFDAVAAQTVRELAVFGYVPAGGERTVRTLLEKMW